MDNKIKCYKLYSYSNKKGIGIVFDNDEVEFFNLDEINKAIDKYPEISDFYEKVYIYPNDKGERYILKKDFDSINFDIDKKIGLIILNKK